MIESKPIDGFQVPGPGPSMGEVVPMLTAPVLRNIGPASKDVPPDSRKKAKEGPLVASNSPTLIPQASISISNLPFSYLREVEDAYTQSDVV